MRNNDNWRGKRLREALEAAGITSEEMGEKLHVSGAAVRNWCLGIREIGLDEVTKFADIVGYPVEYFVRQTYQLPKEFDLQHELFLLAKQITKLSERIPPAIPEETVAAVIARWRREHPDMTDEDADEMRRIFEEEAQKTE